MKITMSGLPYSGKGELRKSLAKELGLSQVSIGDIRRSYATEQGISIHKLNELSEQDPVWDTRADKYQRKWAQKNPNFLLEGRLSYHFIPDSIKLFLDVSPEVAAKRAMAAPRDSEKKCKTIAEQILVNQKRCESDRVRYFNLYGIEDCYDLENFDIVIDTDSLTIEEVLEKTVQEVRAL
jgi:cytidylate kinase